MPNLFDGVVSFQWVDSAILAILANLATLAPLAIIATVFSHLYIEGRGWSAIFAPLST